MQALTPERLRRSGSASTFTIAVDCWPTMVARLPLAVAGSDADSKLADDLARARRLATLLGEGMEVNAALSRTLIEPPLGEDTVPYVEIEISEWGGMRAQLLLEVVAIMGSAATACSTLGISRRRLRRELLSARRGARRVGRSAWRSAAR